MPQAQLMLRADPAYRVASFRKGLLSAGYTLAQRIASPQPQDALVIWNRYGQSEVEARRFERAGASVLVAENGYLGREWNGEVWYAVSRGQHNGAGSWSPREQDRWSELAAPLAPWRESGREIVVLATRSIGPSHVAEPRGWSAVTAARLRAHTTRPVRVRAHPGERGAPTPLLSDLRDAWAVVTWGSGAALKALVAGIPVFHGFERWIGARAAQPASADLEQPFRGDRTPMLRELAWAMWRLDEIERGDCFCHLLSPAE